MRIYYTLFLMGISMILPLPSLAFSLDLFKDPTWKAVAYYRDEAYEKAAHLFEKEHTAEGSYNAGNAWAALGNYQKAIRSYTRALALDPDHKDASYNRALLQKLQSQKGSGTSASSQREEGSQKLSQSQNTSLAQTQKEDPQKSNMQARSVPSSRAREDAQSEAQWLHRIPDPSDSLLQQKFLRDYLKRHGET